ncbi:MAG: shikimate kinase AroL [Thermogemmata sp.]|jgi:shikimate kinase|uniref:Shikimate kinase n=1 Tax=Thermogemmata fonticola TaxID=2755323 RepID=A0A7V9AAY5_9BACT|nr:shikimate kinase AroL [Thermogemmata fonticola]MBA2225384.1 shikimate kinase AroL [Thermogemmata fonticola]MCX8138768.1 shikimate kinase AroL [Gemmataceae bacterium]GIW84759.1 MAG: shikimate kinase [Gemmataceae bacterium]
MSEPEPPLPAASPFPYRLESVPQVQPRTPRILLVGYRGTGKSTVGRSLAAALKWSFVDCDEEVERLAGRSIADIFAQEGEERFREREAAVLREVCQQQECVIATGGGVVLRESNRLLLRQAGWVVWLRAEPEIILSRLQRDPWTAARRPALTEQGGLAEICTLLVQRTPLYAAVADHVVDTDRLSPQAVVAAILTAWSGGTWRR